ncbi:MAG: rhodanese-like domain-containing protein [Candidatus Neomarinimicrobiota bacterium]
MDNSSFEMISFDDAKDMIEDESSLILDIRDEVSYGDSHYPNAIHLSNQNFNKVIEKTDRKKTILVYCYKGISSQNVAQHLCNLGFENVYSLNGGYKKSTVE